MTLPQLGWHELPEACKAQDSASPARELRISRAIAAGRNETHARMLENADQAKANGDDVSIPEWAAILVARVDTTAAMARIAGWR